MKKLITVSLAGVIAFAPITGILNTPVANAETVETNKVAVVNTKYKKIFTDVSAKNEYYDIIHTMAGQGIISGYENGQFRPSEKISRKHAAALITRSVNLKQIKSNTKPKDLSKSNAYYKDLMAMLNAGIIATDSKGNINPNKELTRGELAKALTIAYNLDTSGTNPLKDVSSGYSKYVTALYNNGITTGYEDKTFRENGSLSRAHYAVFMYRAMNNEQKQPPKDTVVEDSYISQYNDRKVPVPKKYNGVSSHELYNIKTQDFEKLKALMPKGSYASRSDISNAESYSATLNKLSDITGTSNVQLVKHIDESAKTGNTVFFTGGNEKKYFVIFDYTMNSLLLGEDHRK